MIEQMAEAGSDSSSSDSSSSEDDDRVCKRIYPRPRADAWGTAVCHDACGQPVSSPAREVLPGQGPPVHALPGGPLGGARREVPGGVQEVEVRGGLIINYKNKSNNV